MRKTLTLDGVVTGETWLGKPAIVVRGERVVPSDGLTGETSFRTVQAWDERGERIGAVELPGGGEARVQDGWIIEPTGTRNTSVGVRRADDFGPGRVFTCEPGDDCSISTRGRTAVVVGAGESPILVEGTVFTFEDVKDDTLSRHRRLVAFDASTGARRWDTDTVRTPANTDPLQLRSTYAPDVVGTVNGKLVIAWMKRPSGRLVGLYDPVTGALTATGPSPKSLSVLVTDPTGSVVVLGGEGAETDSARSTAWEPASGRTLWQQSDDEISFTPNAIVGGVLYGRTRAGTTIALDVRSKQVLARDLDVDDLPLPLGTDHALVVDGTRAFVFRTRAG
ncbi:outer membrane protein assembly factor BamB family protein [Embleya hyalina]|uniref:outer membrane protein assembly factor BamB family protein n=1 Tax=Embleya hyalina TaxID=516124 RepID=UPI00135986BB|nr:PQQ-binding-like beta-propeller repeat protein [Embleya hyalina]